MGPMRSCGKGCPSGKEVHDVKLQEGVALRQPGLVEGRRHPGVDHLPDVHSPPHHPGVDPHPDVDNQPDHVDERVGSQVRRKSGARHFHRNRSRAA